MARQKQVYPTPQIVHLWAHKTQESARNPQGNLYFRGDYLYSYRDSYPIARHVDFNGQPAVLIQADKYSSTTAKHIYAARRAVPFGVPIFETDDLEWGFIGAQTYADKQSQGALEKLLSSKSKPSKAKAWDELQRLEVLRHRLYAFIGEPFQDVAAGVVDFAELNNISENHRANVEENRRKIEDKRRAKHLEWQRLELLTQTEKIEAWREGKYVGSMYYVPTMLRIQGNEVQTSRGAVFPLDHAKRYLKLIKAMVNAGASYYHNDPIEQPKIRLGHYQIDRVTSDGTIYAGCHEISKDEALRFIESVENLDKQVGLEITA